MKSEETNMVGDANFKPRFYEDVPKFTKHLS